RAFLKMHVRYKPYFAVAALAASEMAIRIMRKRKAFSFPYYMPPLAVLQAAFILFNNVKGGLFGDKSISCGAAWRLPQICSKKFMKNGKFLLTWRALSSIIGKSATKGVLCPQTRNAMNREIARDTEVTSGEYVRKSGG
ncbi:MAG: hypothetical protein K6G54_04925, partial [Oscillospiraceae bacterium]|nr:hypothetical protein [Oscillospiraceae bacterium]